jgi:hypothetical protein
MNLPATSVTAGTVYRHADRHGADERDAVHDTIRQSDPTGQACINPCALDYD